MIGLWFMYYKSNVSDNQGEYDITLIITCYLNSCEICYVSNIIVNKFKFVVCA